MKSNIIFRTSNRVKHVCLLVTKIERPIFVFKQTDIKRRTKHFQSFADQIVFTTIFAIFSQWYHQDSKVNEVQSVFVFPCDILKLRSITAIFQRDFQYAAVIRNKMQYQGIQWTQKWWNFLEIRSILLAAQ